MLIVVNTYRLVSRQTKKIPRALWIMNRMLEAPCNLPNSIAEGESITGMPCASALSLRAFIQGIKTKAAATEQNNIANKSQRMILNW
jgi:hypothetical protein